MELTFHGAAGTVTGSRFQLQDGDTRVWIDCGLFQGVKGLRLRNWDDPPVDPASLDAILLTHAHIDHSGYLPLMVRRGFSGPIYCSKGTADLLRILLPDSAWIQEEDARRANHYGYSKHSPAVPLYDRKDVKKTLPLIREVEAGQTVDIGSMTASWSPVGHILGASAIRVRGSTGTIGFSGDVGRFEDPIMLPPHTLEPVDWLVLESTYGNRLHGREKLEEQFAAVVNPVLKRNGVMLVPAFAVGRSQQLLHLLSTGMASGQILPAPVFLDSPMAISATETFCKHIGDHALSETQCSRLRGDTTFVREAKASMALETRRGPMVLIAASGMATGGRVLHHLKTFAPDPNNAIMIVGYQAAGTRGDALVNGVERLKIHGEHTPIAAQVHQLHGLSAHADWQELVAWLKPLPAPKRTFIVHGAPASADAMRVHLRDELGWPATVAMDGQTVTLR